ncbi:hypothetical protein TPMD03_29 [Thiohalocapsa phage LS06-2018-MD03]|nr:hypothetical protein TPMD03_29 [Thiohalocapsa phage LS06-2018-MD03]
MVQYVRFSFLGLISPFPFPYILNLLINKCSFR